MSQAIKNTPDYQEAIGLDIHPQNLLWRVKFAKDSLTLWPVTCCVETCFRETTWTAWPTCRSPARQHPTRPPGQNAVCICKQIKLLSLLVSFQVDRGSIKGSQRIRFTTKGWVYPRTAVPPSSRTLSPIFRWSSPATKQQNENLISLKKKNLTWKSDDDEYF